MGFTLMELLLVLVVISVVLAISAPSLRGFFASRQTADAATTVLALTKSARSEAVTQGRTCRLNLNASTGEFWVTVQEAGAFVPAGFPLGQRFRVPEGAALAMHGSSGSSAPAAPYVQFYPGGRSDVATIEIRGKRDDVFLVTCPSATEPFRVISPSEAH